MTVVDPHLRSDAARNLVRILDAARDVFAERGLDASVADVAQRAEVGTATIFRRFPTKDDLCAAVMERELATTLALIQDTASLEQFMTTAIERFVGNRCLCELAGSELFERPQLADLIEALTGAVARLLAAEQKAGTVRRDIVPADIGFFLTAIGQAGVRLELTAPGAWRRYLELVLDGLKPDGASRLKHKAPTPQQLHDAKTA
jgi:AcrR family transcriptional regulator